MAIAVTGLVITASVTLWMWDTARDERARQLENHGQVLADSIDAALNEVVARLVGVASFYRASEDVSADSFRSYTENLETVPGMRGLGYIPILTTDELAEYEADQAETRPGYFVFELDGDGNRVPTSPRALHAPVQYFEPADDPARPHGFDTASEPLRREALTRAIIDSSVAVTSFLPLVNETQENSFLIYLPVTDPENGSVTGFTVAPMELRALLDGQVSASLAEQIDWEIENVSLATSTSEPAEGGWSTSMDVGQNLWNLTVTWDEERIDHFQTNLTLVALAGLATSFLATVVFYQYRRKKEAQGELEQLRTLTLAKDEFLASVSHELRTPLTGVLGFAELLRDEQSDLSDDERRSMISKVAEEATDLASIIDDLLVAARSELDLLAITKVPVALKAQVAQVVETCNDSIRTRVEVVGTAHRGALGDPGRIRQIVRNLISNANRYGGERVEIRVGSDDELAWLEVADNGPGLLPAEWERIFEPYYRAHENRGGQPDALGIGLSVARHLARLMNGDLRYRRANGWSAFTLTLPVATPTVESGQRLQEVTS